MSDNYKHFKLIQQTSNFYEFQHNYNKLKVVLIPHASHKQIVHAQMIYHIGSYDELVSYTGSTHLLEHLLFKNFEKSIDGDTDNIFQKLNKWGATINATTSTNRTNFIATIPAKVFDVWAACEAKRMQYAPFDVEGKDQKEKHVVVDELRIGQGNPFQKLTSAVVGAAFDRSGYSHLTSGSIADVQQTTQERLKKFHHDYYGPNNCSLVVVGPLSVSKVLRSVHNHFGQIKMRSFTRIQRDELEQKGPRSVAVYSKMPYSMFQIAFRNMEGTHKDSVVLDLIAELMQYENIGVMWMLKQMNAVPSFGVINNRTKHRYLFQIVGSLPNSNPKVEQAVIAQVWSYLNALKTQTTPENILNLVKKSLLNKYNSKSGVEGIGALATEAVSLGNINDIWTRQEALKKVTSEDVRRVANYIFQQKRSTIGTLMPEPKGIIDRPSPLAPEYKNSLFQVNYMQQRMTRELLESFELPERVKLKSNRYRCKFGVLQHLVVPGIPKTYMLLTTKASSANDALTKVACRVIREGIPQSQVEADRPLLFQSENEARLMNNLHTYMTNKNMSLAMEAKKQKLTISLSLDAEHDIKDAMQKLLTAMSNMAPLNAQQFSMKAVMEAGQWQGVLQDTYASSQQRLTELLFDKDDINHTPAPQQMIEKLKRVTMADMSQFKNELFEAGRPFAVTMLTNEKKNIDDLGKAASLLWDRFQGKKRVMENPFDDHTSNHLVVQPSLQKIKLQGKPDGHGVMGVRVAVDKNNPVWTHLSLGINIFGSGMYSRLNKKLRIADGRTYGAYARLRGGQYSSDSYVHVFASFSNDTIKEDTEEMRKLWDEFVKYGVTKKEFEEAKMHMENSLNVAMDNLENLIGLSHNTLMNNKNLNLMVIMDRIKNTRYEDVNNAIEDHLKGKPVVTIIAGDV
tara:strand:+ start:1756 stop:4479 length:2724 start_codon:yes stop_codon:yes gene_type:complete